MAQSQAKPKAVKGRNDNRTNGKKWKKKWGENPPVEQSKKDHDRNQNYRSQQKTVKRGKRGR